jgi:hypothetical protein
MNISQTFNVPGVGQNKPPKWAKPACQTQQKTGISVNCPARLGSYLNPDFAGSIKAKDVVKED